MMSKHPIKFLLRSGLLILASFTTVAAPDEWEMIPAESQLTFTATQNGAPVSGEFKAFSAKLVADPNDLKNSSIDIIVDMNSISASYDQLKDTLISADWFNVKLFPKAEFKANEFKKTGDNAYQALGTLTIRDKTLPVTLSFTSNLSDPKKGSVNGTTTIKRNAFGVGQGDWASTDQIKDDVTVTFKVTANKR